MLNVSFSYGKTKQSCYVAQNSFPEDNRRMNKRFFYANTWFTLPIRANGYWVEDANRKNLAEAVNNEMAKALAQTLNFAAEVQIAARGMK